MLNRKTVAIVLVTVGAVVLAGFLAMAIYGEVTRPRGTERMAKLILISAWDTRTPDEEAVIFKDTYGGFLRLDLDVEMAYTKEGLARLVAVEARLNLTNVDQVVVPADNAEYLGDEQAMFDKLYVWFSAEDTELDKTAETTSKQFNFLSVSSQEMSHILKRLGSTTSTEDLLVIEAWPPAEIRILTMEPDRNTLHHFRDTASFDILRKDLCPASGPDDSQCIFDRE